MKSNSIPSTLSALASALLLASCGGGEPTPIQTRPTAGSAAPAVESCNRQCLLDAANAYIAALVAHDPSRAPLADNVVFVENVQRMQPGEGLWQSVVQGPGRFQVHVPDEINQSVGYLAMMTYMAPPQAPQGVSAGERAAFLANAAPIEQPVIVGMRLQFDGKGRITEAEHLLSGVREAQLVNLQAPRSGIFTEIPVQSRLPHEQLIRIGLSYYDALDDNDGSLAPFAPDCERHENGMITASPDPGLQGPAIPGTAATPRVARDCARQLDSNTFQYIDRIDNRRVFAADPQTGLVMGLSHFRHPMNNLPYLVTNLDGSTSERNSDNLNFAPFDLPAAHIYKIGPDGLIHEIEAMGFSAPLNSPTGWE